MGFDVTDADIASVQMKVQITMKIKSIIKQLRQCSSTTKAIRYGLVIKEEERREVVGPIPTGVIYWMELKQSYLQTSSDYYIEN